MHSIIDNIINDIDSSTQADDPHFGEDIPPSNKQCS